MNTSKPKFLVSVLVSVLWMYLPKNFIFIAHAIGKLESHLTLEILTLKPGKKCFDDLVSYTEDIVINEGEVVRISCI